MNPGTYNLDIYRGDTRRWQLRLWTDVAKTQATDLTGVTVIATIRDEAIGGVFELALACTVTLPNIINMLLTPDQSRTLPAVGVWDLQLNYSNGDTFTPLKGAVVVTQDVTRPVAVVNPL
jgi:hypothetical protein